MATEALLNTLNQGRHAWNQWRQQNPDVFIDLTDVKLSNLDLSGYDLSYADLSGSDLRGTRLVDADLTFALVINTRMTRDCLKGAKVHGANLELARFEDDSPPPIATTRPVMN